MKRIATRDGTMLHVEESGNGPPVLLVHGYALDGRLWDDQIAPLSARHRVIRVDLRGFGRSDPPAAGVSYTHADDLFDLLTALETGPAAIAGLSLGGWVALEFALTHPALTASLILVDAALREFDHDPTLGAFIAELYRIGRTDPDAAKPFWLEHPFFAVTRADPAAFARLAAMTATYGGWHWRHDDPHPPLTPAAIHRLAEVAVPTLVLAGQHDLPDFHRAARFLASGIRGARLQTIPGAGHLPPIDAPDQFNRALLAFLAPGESG